MSYPSRDEILASSKGWVASFLNFLPGLGSGYLYQRRWKPYFFTITASTAWFALGFFLQGDSEPSQSEQIIGISGLFFISIVTICLLYTSPSPRDQVVSRMPSSA